MNKVYYNIQKAIGKRKKQLAVLIDPEKFLIENVPGFIKKVNKSKVTHVFVGGSTVKNDATEILVTEIKKFTKLPIVLFPGDVSQITDKADVLLFLSLISGRNAEYLIGKHVKTITRLRTTSLEVIPTGYILIENGKETAVQQVTGTKPMARKHIQEIADTAKAGALLGMNLMYLKAGSGATHPINPEIINSVKQEFQIPIIVDGGIKSIEQLETTYNAGADLVVIGTAFEADESFFDELKKEQK
ncbi:MAG: geranylgeranylglyceryl/heptaprenylglyceryl phosphate synthase [Tamlana sp.]